MRVFLLLLIAAIAMPSLASAARVVERHRGPAVVVAPYGHRHMAPMRRERPMMIRRGYRGMHRPLFGY